MTPEQVREKCIEEIARFIRKNPHMRVGQTLFAFAHWGGKDHFNTHDNEFLAVLQEANR